MELSSRDRGYHRYRRFLQERSGLIVKKMSASDI